MLGFGDLGIVGIGEFWDLGIWGFGGNVERMQHLINKVEGMRFCIEKYKGDTFYIGNRFADFEISGLGNFRIWGCGQLVIKQCSQTPNPPNSQMHNSANPQSPESINPDIPKSPHGYLGIGEFLDLVIKEFGENVYKVQLLIKKVAMRRFGIELEGIHFV